MLTLEEKQEARAKNQDLRVKNKNGVVITILEIAISKSWFLILGS
jgi:hypothetical protein